MNELHRLPTIEETIEANDAWGANCGPYAACAVLGVSLQRLRDQHLDCDWPGWPGYTNPTFMRTILGRDGRYFFSKWPPRNPAIKPYYQVRSPGDDFIPRESAYSLIFVQLTGPWTESGVPARAAYPHTHWIAMAPDGQLADVNAPGLWMEREQWHRREKLELVAANRRATGATFKLALVLPTQVG